MTTPGRILELGNLKDRLPFYTKNATKIEITDAYIVFNRGFKLSDMNLLYQKVVVPGMGAGEKLGDEMKVTRLADVNKTLQKPSDLWSIKFADAVAKPEKLWMIIRYKIG